MGGQLHGAEPMSLSDYLKKYTSGHATSRKIEEMYKDPTKYSYEDFVKQLDKAKYIPQREDYMRSVDEYDEFDKPAYSAARGEYLGIRNSLLSAFNNARNTQIERAPTPAPTPAPAPATPQATLRVQAPTTPQVSTNESANQVAALQKALADSIAGFQDLLGKQTESNQKQLSDYLNQAEQSQRQMMIGLAQRDRAPAEVKMAQSGAAQQGLTRRGTTGYFGRQGMRIGSLNVPTSGLTISTDAAGRAASGSFM